MKSTICVDTSNVKVTSLSDFSLISDMTSVFNVTEFLSNNRSPNPMRTRPQSQNGSSNSEIISDLGHSDICSETVGEDVFECAAAVDGISVFSKSNANSASVSQNDSSHSEIVAEDVSQSSTL